MASNRSTKFLSVSPFYRRLPSYLKEYEINTADFKQCWIDWLRDGVVGGFIINNLSSQIHAEAYKNFITPELLMDFWNDRIISNVLNHEMIYDKELLDRNIKQNEIKAKALQNYLSKYFHQGGLNFILQATLIKYLYERGYTMDSRHADRQLKIKTVRGKIFFHEKVEASGLRNTELPETLLTPKEANQKIPLITAELMHHLSIDDAGNIKHFFDDLALQFDSRETQELLDQDQELRGQGIGLLEYLRKTFLGQGRPDPSTYTLKITPPRSSFG